MTKEEKRRKDLVIAEKKIVSHAFALLQADGCKYPWLLIKGGNEPERLYDSKETQWPRLKTLKSRSLIEILSEC